MLDVGLYQLDQQVACQRIGKQFVIATAFTRVKTFLQDGAATLVASLTPQVAFASLSA